MDSIEDRQFFFSTQFGVFQFPFCCFCLLNYEKEINFTKSTPIKRVTVMRHVSSMCFKYALLLVPEVSLFGLNFLSLKHSSPSIDSKHSAKFQLLAFSGYLVIGPKQPTSLLVDCRRGRLGSSTRGCI